MARPYIGVTGFSRLAEAHELEMISGRAVLPAGYDLCPGVLVSRSSLDGEIPRSSRYPIIDEAVELLVCLGSMFPTAVHFNSHEVSELAKDIDRLLRETGLYASGACRRVQLNVANPSVEQLEDVRRDFPQLELILQIPAWKHDLQSSESIKRYIGSYVGLIDYVLIDPSGGRGKGLSEHVLAVAAEAMGDHMESFQFGIAGGLCADNVASAVCSMRRLLGPVQLCLDAESQIRGGRRDGKRVGDRLNPSKIELYLSEASEALNPC